MTEREMILNYGAAIAAAAAGGPSVREQAHKRAMERIEAAQLLDDDPHGAHIEADKALCDLLSSCGYQDVVEAWRDVPRLYS